jgi:hypothetical protein
MRNTYAARWPLGDKDAMPGGFVFQMTERE